MKALSSGVPHLDVVLGINGLCFGKIYEIFGSESSGKSSFVQSLLILLQDKVDKIYYYDSENSLDKPRYKLIGGDLSKLKDEPISYFEDFASDIINTLKKTPDDKSTIIVWDTLAGTIPKNDKGIQKRPQMVRELLSNVTHLIKSKKTVFIVLNQIYSNIGGLSRGVTSLGGRGIRHFAHARFHIKRVKTIKRIVAGVENVYAYEASLEGVKNKIVFEKLLCPLLLNMDSGINVFGSIILFLQKIKVLEEKSGGWKVIKVGDKEYKFQQPTEISNFWDEVEDYVYLETYKYYMSISPILKIKLSYYYNKLCKEFGLPEAELTEEEKEAYNLYLEGLEGEEDDN